MPFERTKHVSRVRSCLCSELPRSLVYASMPGPPAGIAYVVTLVDRMHTVASDT
jgi:hypothetical protein